MREVLIGRCGMRELVIGHDHGFGRARSGDVETLKSLGQRHGFAVDVVPPGRGRRAPGVEHPDPPGGRRGRPGHRGPAAGPALLGRAGGWCRAAGAGPEHRDPDRSTWRGVPARKLLPPDGVYAVWVEWRGGRAAGMLNQGPRPTFGDTARGVEVHLFDFAGDLYGEWVKVEWVARLRDVRRFASPDDAAGAVGA